MILWFAMMAVVAALSANAEQFSKELPSGCDLVQLSPSYHSLAPPRGSDFVCVPVQ